MLQVLLRMSLYSCDSFGDQNHVPEMSGVVHLEVAVRDVLQNSGTLVIYLSMICNTNARTSEHLTVLLSWRYKASGSSAEALDVPFESF